MRVGDEVGKMGARVGRRGRWRGREGGKGAVCGIGWNVLAENGRWCIPKGGRARLDGESRELEGDEMRWDELMRIQYRMSVMISYRNYEHTAQSSFTTPAPKPCHATPHLRLTQPIHAFFPIHPISSSHPTRSIPPNTGTLSTAPPSYPPLPNQPDSHLHLAPSRSAHSLAPALPSAHCFRSYHLRTRRRGRVRRAVQSRPPLRTVPWRALCGSANKEKGKEKKRCGSVRSWMLCSVVERVGNR